MSRSGGGVMNNPLKNWKQRQDLADSHNAKLAQEREALIGCALIIGATFALAVVLKIAGLVGIW